MILCIGFTVLAMLTIGAITPGSGLLGGRGDCPQLRAEDRLVMLECPQPAHAQRGVRLRRRRPEEGHHDRNSRSAQVGVITDQTGARSAPKAPLPGAAAAQAPARPGAGGRRAGAS
jgi:hypothetical protein